MDNIMSDTLSSHEVAVKHSILKKLTNEQFRPKAKQPIFEVKVRIVF